MRVLILNRLTTLLCAGGLALALTAPAVAAPHKTPQRPAPTRKVAEKSAKAGKAAKTGKAAKAGRAGKPARAAALPASPAVPIAAALSPAQLGPVADSDRVQSAASGPRKSAEGLFSSVMTSTGESAKLVANQAGDLVLNALNLIGVRYRWGGNTPETGLDCSGFVRYVFNDTLGFLLPRRAKDMSNVGEHVAKSELKPGDLVFFNTMRRTFSHVGIYIGDNKFVHAPRTGSTIRVDNLDENYWSQRFTGARRIDTLDAAEADNLRMRIDQAVAAGDKRL